MLTAPRAIILFVSATQLGCSPHEIVPTADAGSDCVAAIIITVVKQDTIRFFTDRCNAPNEPAYVSFNGKTHEVWHQPGKPHPDVSYAGNWKGDNVVARVQPRKLIQRFEEDRVTYAVDVFIESGSMSANIPAIYDNRL